MKVCALIELLSQHDPDATVVVCDRTELLRNGLIRPLVEGDVVPLLLAKTGDENDTPWLCEHRECPAEEPLPGLLLGPR